MSLSQDLVNQFVKLTNKDDKQKEFTANGTFKKINDQEYVQIDGSDIWTPVTSTVEAETGERVSVLIKNHTATVTGNITSPTARTKTVQNLKDEVDENGNTIKQLDNTIIQQGNSIIQINNEINQQNNVINQHDNVINQQGNVITQLNNKINEQNNTIDSINNTIVQHSNNIEQVNNDIVQQNNVINQQNNIINQQGSIINEHGANIDIFDSDIKILNSGFVIQDGVLTGLSKIVTDELVTNTLQAKYANIDFANIGIAAIRKVFADSGIIKDLVVQDQHITGELVGVTLKGDLIEGNTIKADKLVVRGSDGLYYKLNIDGIDNISTEEAAKFVLTTEEPEDWETNYKDYYIIDTTNNEYVHVSGDNAPTWSLNTYYKLSATYQSGLDGTVIVAKSVTADKVQVSDLVAFDATIGGFNITNNAIYSGAKASVDNTTRGIYMDRDGQFAIGDNNNFFKYFKDTNDNNKWKIAISANSFIFSESGKDISDEIDDTVVEKFNDLSIGGRNYLLESELEREVVRNGGNTFDKYEFSSDLLNVKDNIFTFSIEIKSESETELTCDMYFRHTDGTLMHDSYAWKATSEYRRVNKTIELTKDISNLGLIIFRLQTDGTIHIRRAKLEVGNKATDWTPAPEDINKSIKDVDEKAQAADDKAGIAQKTANDADKLSKDLNEWKTEFISEHGTFEMRLNGVRSAASIDAQDKADVVQHNLEQDQSDRRKYMRYSVVNNKGTLELGDIDSTFKTRIDNTELGFYEGNNKVSYINGLQMYITVAQILNTLKIGNFGFTVNSDNSITFGKVK